MKPTLRAALLISLGIPLSLVLIIWDESLWLFGVVYLFLVLLLIGVDFLNSLQPSRIALSQKISPVLYAGHEDYAYFSLSVSSRHRAYGLEALLDVDDEYLTRPDVVKISRRDKSQEGEIAFPLIVKRRGSASISRLWVKWYSPWGLVERQTTWELDCNLSILPNVHAVKAAALQIARRVAA